RIFRVLQDHGDAVAAQRPTFSFRDIDEIDAAELQLLRIDLTVFGCQAHDGAPGLRLTGTGFAHDAQPFAAERERYPSHRLDHARAGGERNAQVFDFKKRAHWPLPFGSSASRNPS